MSIVVPRRQFGSLGSQSLHRLEPDISEQFAILIDNYDAIYHFILFAGIDTLEDIFALPPPSCSVLQFNLTKAPNRIRTKFANKLYEVAELHQIDLHGYIRRLVMQTVEVKIVVAPCFLKDVAPFLLLARSWDLERESVGFEELNYVEVERLQRRFEIVKPADEDGFSNDIDVPDKFSIVSSIHLR